ncbi:hypothetical protein ES703_85795 [subsurface metagenome]
MRKHIIRAVHEQDLGELLKSLGLSELMTKGALRCSICGSIVNLDNLLCIYPSGDEVKVCCKNPECYEKVLREVG